MHYEPARLLARRHADRVRQLPGGRVRDRDGGSRRERHRPPDRRRERLLGLLVARWDEDPVLEHPVRPVDRTDACRASPTSTGCPTDIYLMDADGSNVVRLTDDPASEYQPVWSPDGSEDRVRSIAGRSAALAPGDLLTMRSRWNRRSPDLERGRRQRLLAELVARRIADRLRGDPERRTGGSGPSTRTARTSGRSLAGRSGIRRQPRAGRPTGA